MNVLLLFTLIGIAFSQNIIILPETSNCVIHRGTHLNISCSSEKYEPEELEWVGPFDKVIPESSTQGRITTERQEDKIVLVFTIILVKDTGSYVCRSRSHEDSAEINISVLGPPEFDEEYDHHDSHVGDDIWISCEAHSSVPVNYTWLNQLSQDLSKVEGNWVVFDHNGTLAIFSISKGEGGLYSCTAASKFGNSTKLYLINVRDRQEPNKTKLEASVMTVTPTSVQFNIQIENSLSYVVVYYNTSSKFLSTPEVTMEWKYEGSYTYYIIGELKPEQKYYFMFGVRDDRYKPITWFQNQVLSIETPIFTPNLIVKNVRSFFIEVEWPYRSFDELRGPNAIDYHILRYVELKQKSATFYETNCPLIITIPACYGRKYIIGGVNPDTYYKIQLQAHFPTSLSNKSEIIIRTPK